MYIEPDIFDPDRADAASAAAGKASAAAGKASCGRKQGAGARGSLTVRSGSLRAERADL